MITITIYGLDQFIIGRYSGEHNENLAQLFETSPDNINFCAPDAYVFHNGTEQTSWNTIIQVHAPEKYEVLEEKVAKYLLDTLKEFSINLSVEFTYFHSHHRYEHINKDYPRYIAEDNLVNVEDSEDSDELYEGNIFEGMEEKLEAAYKNDYDKAEKHDHCCCHNEHCDCDDDCCCDDEHCDCDDEHCECHHKN